MSFLRAYSYDAGRIMAAANPGDTLGLGENATVFNAAGAVTVTGPALAGRVILRQGAGAVSDIMDAAVNIMQALYGNTGSAPRAGESFTCLFSNWGASTVTLTGNTGTTVQGNSAVLALTTKILLVTCTNPGVQTFAAGVYTNVGATFTVSCL